MGSEALDDESIAEFADALMTISHGLELRGQALRELSPLPRSEVVVIREIVRNPRTTPTRIAAATGMKRSNISTAIKALEARGLLTREAPTGDGRSVELIATELTTDSMQRLRDWWVSRLRSGAISDLEQIVTVREALARIADSLANDATPRLPTERRPGHAAQTD